MRFNTKEDIEAPIEFVFAQVADVDAHERSAMRRGIEARRQGALVAKGTKWHVKFDFRGKPRTADIELTIFDQPTLVEFNFESGGVAGVSRMELVPLSPNRTRMMVQIDLTPKTLAARLLVQSLKLAKANITKKFKTRVADLCEDIEKRHVTA